MKTRTTRRIALLIAMVALLGWMAPAAFAATKSSGKVTGTITQYEAKRAITIRADGADWSILLTSKNVMVLGKPAVDKQATVWYRKDKGNLRATKVEVVK